MWERWLRGGLLHGRAGSALTGALVAITLGPVGTASAEVRTATVQVPTSTPTLALNVRTLQVAVDTATGAGSLRVQFWTPVPTQSSAFGNSLELDVTASEAACGGAARPEGVGDLHLFVSGRSEYATQVRVKFRPPGTPARVAATLNPERTELTTSFTDELLREADLRCLTWSTTGQAYWDPTLPDGGPSRYAPARGQWLDGLRPAFKLALRGARKQRTSAFFPSVRFDARCALACALQVRGHVTTPRGKRVRGVRIRIDRELRRAQWSPVVYQLWTDEQWRRLQPAFKRHGRLRVKLRVQARDADGRGRSASRVITLRAE